MYAKKQRMRITRGKWHVWPRQCSHLGPQEAKRASGATFIMKIGFRAKRKERAAKDRISIYQSVSLAESAKTHATRTSKFRRPSRYLLRARKYRDGE